ncbi:RIP metalloprotease RseP [alpha proteobacterium AAP81b]|nr:RIP metalloprotease RseP [alpha proteobacterium AAP81b]
MLPQPGVVFSLATYVLMVAILVVVHEGGHYLAGRLFGCRIDSFAFGFGGEIVGWNDRRGTRWKLNAIPLGGYVKFTGDMNEASQPDPALLALPPAEREQLFVFKPLWQRAIIVAAGPAINFVFAILILAGFYIGLGHPVTPPVATQIMPGSVAAAAGLRPGDRITAVDGVATTRFEDIFNKVMVNAGEPMRLTVARGGATRDVTLVPRVVEEKDRFGNVSRHGRLGLLATGRELVRVGPVAALGLAVRDTWEISASIATTIGQIVTGTRSLSEMGGPIKAGVVTGQQASLGVLAFVAFMAFFSINLGFINLLPIPMLDGGHLLLYAVEAIRRQPIGAKVQEWAFMSGFAALMSLMAVLTWHDLGAVGVFHTLSRWVG